MGTLYDGARSASSNCGCPASPIAGILLLGSVFPQEYHSDDG